MNFKQVYVKIKMDHFSNLKTNQTFVSEYKVDTGHYEMTNDQTMNDCPVSPIRTELCKDV